MKALLAVLSVIIIASCVCYYQIKIASYKYIFCDHSSEIAYFVSYVQQFVDAKGKLPTRDDLRMSHSALSATNLDAGNIYVPFGPGESCTLHIMLDSDKQLHFAVSNNKPFN